MSTVSAIKRQALQSRYDALLEEFTAVDQEITYTIDVTTQVKLKRRLASLEKELEQIDAEIKALESAPQPSATGQTARAQRQAVDQELRAYQAATTESGAYRYRVQVTDRGQRVGVEILRPDRSSVTLPRGKCQLDPLPERIADLSTKARRGSASSSELAQLGEALFEALLPRELAANLRDLIDQAGLEQAKVRLELDLDEAELPLLAALPWELLRAPQTSGRAVDTLGTHPTVALVRRRALWSEAAPIKRPAQLRILLVVSEPNDPSLGPVVSHDVEATLQRLADEFPALIAPLSPVLRNPKLHELTNTVEHVKPDLLHFIGHGRLRRVRGMEFGEFALVNAAGGADWRADTEIGEIFQAHRPALVIFQSCESGASSHSQALVGVASQVVQQNVPVVIAMQYPISNQAANIFAEEFYRRLSLGERVDTAVQLARRRLRQDKTAPRDFAAPVAFVRVEDGRLFEGTLPQQASRPVTSGPATTSPPARPRASGPIDKRVLRDVIVNLFSLEDLDKLCLDIEEELRAKGISEPFNLELVGGSGKTSKVLNMIGYLERRGRLNYLIDAVQLARPDAI